jgi:pseudaminic acid cytidylyltransferase
VAQKCGAEVPFRRPPELSNDFVGTDDVLVHALQWLAGQGQPADYACCLYATAPFIQVEYLRQGFEQLRTKSAASAFAVTTYAYTIFRSLKQSDGGRVEMVWPENYQKRAQDCPEVFHDAGQFYWVDVQKYRMSGKLIGADAVPVHIPRYLVQDIDTPEDWETAELMFEGIKGRKSLASI